MKIRTDFVTNSSSSGFVCFHVENKELYDFLTELGIRFENTEAGVFTNKTRVILPSGRSSPFVKHDDSSFYPYISQCSSISAWLIAVLLCEIGECCWEDYDEFGLELIDLLDSVGITHMDPAATPNWTRSQLLLDLEAQFGYMDGTIHTAEIEHVDGFEGELGQCVYAEVKDGQRILAGMRELGIDTEECRDKCFAITGDLIHCADREQLAERIQQMGGRVSEKVSDTTDYLICNDIHSLSAEMNDAKSRCVPVLSETAFIRRFCNVADFDGLKDDISLSEEAWEMTYTGNFPKFVADNGIQPFQMQVWKDGRWE